MFIAACIGITVGLVLYLFYWNRFIAFIIGLFIRLLWWKSSDSSVWVEIGSIHFSLMAGRILFKDLRYHSSNQTFKIAKGQFTWAYWIRNPTTQHDVCGSRIDGRDAFSSEKSSANTRRCRVQLSFEGVEWFLYNRTAPYDDIVSQMMPDFRPSDERGNVSDNPSLADSEVGVASASVHGECSRITSSIWRALVAIRRQFPNLDPKSLFPVGIELIRGAIICGNLSTPSLLVLEFQVAHGTFGAVQARSRHDLYKQLLNLSFQQVNAQLIDNSDYRSTLTDNGEVIFKHISPHLSSSSYLFFSEFTKFWNQLGLYALVHPRVRTLFSPKSAPNAKTTRHAPGIPLEMPSNRSSLDPDLPVDYAIERRVLETPQLDMLYYADVVGDVPSLQEQTSSVVWEPFDVGNGDVAPEWGFDIVVRGGFLRYGPWADRERVELQRMFFPPAHRDVEPTQLLKPGDKRLWTSMKIFVELRDETNLRIPFREASKNWQWVAGVHHSHLNKREAASFQITAGDSSSISYIMPMVAGPMGYEPLVEIHLDSVSISSSLNDIPLVAAESCRLNGILRSPLRWNAEREWSFSLSLRQPVLYLLRDHINMLTDLARDWISGPPTDSDRFVPMIYTFQFDMHRYKTFLYANDQNIIDKPLVHDENALFILTGPSFQYQIQIPATTFRPETNTLYFFFQAPDVVLDLSLPRWNTHALHAPKEGSNVWTAGFIRFDGTFHFSPNVRQDFVEQLKIQVSTRDVVFNVLGWAIRYIMVLRDNYFGTFTHFSTLSEYLDKKRKGLPVGDPIAEKYRPGMMNVLQIELDLSISNGSLILPAGLPGYEKAHPVVPQRDVGAHVALAIPEVQVYLRSHDYFMEMSLNIDTTSAYVELSRDDGGLPFAQLGQPNRREMLLIDGIEITANRLFGPQPRTSTYMCFWKVQVGHVGGVLSTAACRVLTAARNALQINFVDPLNAPAAEYAPPLDPDVTFLNMSVSSIDIVWRIGKAAVEIRCPQGFSSSTNNLTGKYHQILTSLQLPWVAVTMYFCSDADSCKSWMEAAAISGDVFLDIYSSPNRSPTRGRAQEKFVRLQDAITKRTLWIPREVIPGEPVQELGDIQSAGFQGIERAHHINGLHLPQMQSCLAVSHNRPAAHMAPDVLTAARAPTLRPFSQSSVSEGDESDRDAHLAHARLLASSQSANNEDASISSMDESDTDGLTNSCATDDESADIDFQNLYTHGYPIGSTSFRRRRPPWLERFLQWEQMPVAPSQAWIRQCDLCDSDISHISIGHGASIDFSRITRIREQEVVTKPAFVFRVNCRKALFVDVTPLLIPAITIFADDICASSHSLELVLDALITTHLQLLLNSEGSAQRTLMELSLSHAHLSIHQELPFPKSTDLPIQSSSESHQRHVTEIILTYHRFLWSGRPDAPTAVVSFDDLSVRTAVASGPLTNMQNRRLTSDVFAAKNRHGWAEYADGRLELVCHLAEMDFGHLSPQLLVDVLQAFAWEQHRFTDIYKKSRRNITRAGGDAIHSVLSSTHGKAIVDPLSTIQPSYLVQEGRPYQLRADITFRFLFHLRSCLIQFLESPLPRTAACEDEANALSLLQSRLSMLALDADRPKVPNIAFLGFSFPSVNGLNHPSPHSRRTFHSLSIRLQRCKIAVRNPSGRSSSEIMLTELSILASLRSLDLVPTLSYPQMTPSQVSLSNRERGHSECLVLSILLSDVDFVVLPQLMTFAQHILRVRRHVRDQADNLQVVCPATDRNENRNTSERWNFHIITSISRLKVHAAAENLTFEFKATGVRVASTFFDSQSFALSSDAILLQARSPGKSTMPVDQDILASLTFAGVKGIALVAPDPTSNSTIRASTSIRDLGLNVPRSAIRLYRFIEEWRADYLPGIEDTLHALLSEIQKTPGTSPEQDSSRSPAFQLHGIVESLGIHLQVMHGTWLSWSLSRSFVYFRSSASLRNFGLQSKSQVLSISPGPIVRAATTSSTSLRLALPMVSISGHYDGSMIETMALMDFFHIKVKPSHWDTLLVVQQKFGQDFTDLMTLIAETRHQQRSSVSSNHVSSRKAWMLFASIKMRGFRVGLEGQSSVVYLECRDVRGVIDQNAIGTWHIQLSDLGLSLASRTVILSQDGNSSRNRLAFVVVDFGVSNEKPSGDDDILSISVTKCHAVLQPSSIREAGDFFNYMQGEIFARKEQRVLELTAFKEKAKSVMKTFNISVRDPDDESSSRKWISRYIVNLSIQNVGAAFPLKLDQGLPALQSANSGLVPVRAFLLSIKSLHFNTIRDEGGQAVMHGFSFQFVSKFRQSVPSDFSGESHQTWNRLVYPEIIARLRSHFSGTSRQIRIGASVSGFILDLDSTMPDHIFSLIDVYHEGEMQVARWATVSRNFPVGHGSERDGSVISERKQRTRTPINSSCFASLTFLSGKVRVFSEAASTISKLRSSVYHHGLLDDHQILDAGAEVFNLPVVSVWGDYRTPSTSHSELIFKSTVHSSRNSLRPVLLHFLNELVGNTNKHFRQWGSRHTAAHGGVPQDAGQKIGDRMTSLRISFSLRIDRSKLELTCQPDVNVVARLHWDSGGFIVNIAPDARLVTFTGSVGGLTVGLKHGFLTEDSLSLDARDLAFSLSFSPVDSRTDSAPSISILLDTHFSGGMRFSRLQDLLCFKAVWLDRFPLLATPADKAMTESSLSNLSSPPPVPSPRTLTAFLLRIRQIDLDVELGQSIGAIKVSFQDALIRNRLTATHNQLTVHIAMASGHARGNLSGHANLPGFTFRTTRCRETAVRNLTEHPRMLEVVMTSGPLNILLDSDHQRLLQYHSAPLQVEIFDDWSLVPAYHQVEDHPLRLSFTVNGEDIIAVMTISTIPKLLVHANKFMTNLEAQREGASRESQAFRVTRSPKPDHPLTAVAQTLLHSARDRLKEAESDLTYIIRQHLSLALFSLRLVVFPRTMFDSEIAHFVGRDVHARLNRVVQSDGQHQTDLHLSTSAMVISKFTQLNHIRDSAASFDCPKWLAHLLEPAVEAIIVGLPSMKISMAGQEDSSRSLAYDFFSQFVRREGMSEQDIYITLNMALYSWLTVLRRNFSREMDQVISPAPRISTSMEHAGVLQRPQASDTSNSANRQHLMPISVAPFRQDPNRAGSLRAKHSHSSQGQPSAETINPTFPSASLNPIFRGSEIISHSEGDTSIPGNLGIHYQPRQRHIERLTMRQLGEATPDVMHPFFMKKAGFNLEEFLPQYIHEYATLPLGQVMEVLLKIYSKQLPHGRDLK